MIFFNFLQWVPAILDSVVSRLFPTPWIPKCIYIMTKWKLTYRITIQNYGTGCLMASTHIKINHVVQIMKEIVMMQKVV